MNLIIIVSGAVWPRCYGAIATNHKIRHCVTWQALCKRTAPNQQNILWDGTDISPRGLLEEYAANVKVSNRAPHKVELLSRFCLTSISSPPLSSACHTWSNPLCYYDGIRIHSDPTNPSVSHQCFYDSTTACGFVISPEMSKIFSTRYPWTLPDIKIGGRVVPYCAQYFYFGVPVRITQGIPVRQHIHPNIKESSTDCNSIMSPESLFLWPSSSCVQS